MEEEEEEWEEDEEEDEEQQEEEEEEEEEEEACCCYMSASRGFQHLVTGLPGALRHGHLLSSKGEGLEELHFEVRAGQR